MDYATILSGLKQKIFARGEDIFLKNDQLFREIKNDLTMKQDCITQLKEKLNAATLENFELTKSLSNSRTVLKEKEFNMKLYLKKSGRLELKVKELSDSYEAQSLNEELKVSEIKSLTECCENLVNDKYKLLCEVEELKNKLRYIEIFESELKTKQEKINVHIQKHQNSMEDLEKLYQTVQGLKNELISNETILNKCEYLKQENEKMKEENTKMEYSLIEMTAKFEKLRSLIRTEEHANEDQLEILGRIKTLQWQTRYNALAARTKPNDLLIASLSKELKLEKEANALLILQCEEYENKLPTVKLAESSVKKETNIECIDLE